jgi:hypothetical protein
MVLIEPSPPTRPTTWRTATCSIFGDAEAFARAHNVPERVQRLLTRSAVPGSSLADLSDYNVVVGGFQVQPKSVGPAMMIARARPRNPELENTIGTFRTC